MVLCQLFQKSYYNLNFQKLYSLSSRNVYLTPEQKEEALKISKSIYMAGNLITKGERDSKIVKDKIYEILENLDVESVS